MTKSPKSRAAVKLCDPDAGLQRRLLGHPELESASSHLLALKIELRRNVIGTSPDKAARHLHRLGRLRSVPVLFANTYRGKSNHRPASDAMPPDMNFVFRSASKDHRVPHSRVLPAS